MAPRLGRVGVICIVTLAVAIIVFAVVEHQLDKIEELKAWIRSGELRKDVRVTRLQLSSGAGKTIVFTAQKDEAEIASLTDLIRTGTRGTIPAYSMQYDALINFQDGKQIECTAFITDDEIDFAILDDFRSGAAFLLLDISHNRSPALSRLIAMVHAWDSPKGKTKVDDGAGPNTKKWVDF